MGKGTWKARRILACLYLEVFYLSQVLTMFVAIFPLLRLVGMTFFGGTPQSKLLMLLSNFAIVA
jgi:hypothetical protein